MFIDLLPIFGGLVAAMYRMVWRLQVAKLHRIPIVCKLCPWGGGGGGGGGQGKGKS